MQQDNLHEWTLDGHPIVLITVQNQLFLFKIARVRLFIQIPFNYKG